jgi:RHS repeat-associated protein
MYGLSHGDNGQHFSDIDYAIYTERAEGKVYVYEGGTSHGQKGTWTSGDRFKVAIEGGYVKYSKNGTVLYSHTVSPTYPLLVDTSLYSSGNTLSNVVISGDLSDAGLRYVLQDVQGTTRVVTNGSGTVVARHDYLPFGEEIGSNIGPRTSGQGYGLSDANRQKYGLTERDQTSGLDHTWFRKYESQSGRWTSPDPYAGSIRTANPQSFNRYSHTQNDPVNFVDPSGLDPDLEEGLDAASAMVKGGLCGSLFRGNDVAALIKKYREGQGKLIRSVPLISGGVQALDVAASTNPKTGVINVNSEGLYFTGMAPVDIMDVSSNSWSTTMRSIYEVGPFKGLSRIEARGVIIIHELLHAIHAIPSDRGDNSMSERNTGLVIARCLHMAPRPFQVIPVTPLILPDTTPTMRPIFGGGALGSLRSTSGFLNWLYRIQLQPRPPRVSMHM